MNNVIPLDQASFIIAIAVLSMLLSPLMIRHVDPLADSLLHFWPGAPAESPAAPSLPLHYAADHVIIGGFGRVGQTVAHLLNANGIPYIGVDTDADVIRLRQLAGDNVVFGDCTNIRILERCHIKTARLAILTFRSPMIAKRTIAHIREQGIETPIIVRCRENVDFEELISLGADHVVPEMLEASLIIGAQALSLLGVGETEINRQLNELRDPDRLA
jgi:CPA2 family monovalent cation:H+ antiporter-2